MECCKRPGFELPKVLPLPAEFCYTSLSHNILQRSITEANNHLRLDHLDFFVEPVVATELRFCRDRELVIKRATCDDVADERCLFIEDIVVFLERISKQFTSLAYEWSDLLNLVFARRFANDHNKRRRSIAFALHNLTVVIVYRTGFTVVLLKSKLVVRIGRKREVPIEDF